MLNMASNTTEYMPFGGGLKVFLVEHNSSIIISLFLFNGCLPEAPIWLCSVLIATPYRLLKIHVSFRLVARLIVSYVTLIARQDRCNLQMMYNYPSMFVACTYACVRSDSQIHLTNVFSIAVIRSSAGTSHRTSMV